MCPPKLWVPACCTPNCCRTSWGAAAHGIHQAWMEAAVVAGQLLALSGQVLIIALFHSGIFYPCYEFSCCFYTSEADYFFISEVSLWFPSYRLIHLMVAAFSMMSLLGQTLLRQLEVLHSHTLFIFILLSHQLLLSRPFCKGWVVQASTTTGIL